MPGWNYLVHLYRPRREILDGSWKFPEALRGTTREALVTLFDEELTQVLGAAKGERVARRGGYRHGEKARALTTGLGRVQVTVPRGRLFTPDGQAREWQSHCLLRYQRRARAPKVAESRQEAGDELLPFYHCPRSQWNSLRTTNVVERPQGEFRRRVKTQGSLPNAQAAELLLFGLLTSGQIRMRRIEGWQ